ncbi:MAG TPA: hypothetical protein VMB50_17375 [Myxococcales bacterium]|nr:hypothetical protein [Myxococcales bacterium]
MRTKLTLAVVLLGVASVAEAGGRGGIGTTPSLPEETESSEASVSPAQALAAYPQRLADRPLSIGQGLAEGSLEGSYLFSSAFGFQETPNVRYGLTSQLEVILLGIRYTVAEDGQYVPGIALRVQLHDAVWQEQPGSPEPYPVARPGLMIDLRDKFPFHLTAEGHAGYLVSFVTGDYLHGGGPIPTGNAESQEIAPMSVALEWSPLDQFSAKGTFGYIYDLLPIPLTPDQTEVVGRLDAVWTPSNRLDLGIFAQGNWYTGPLGYIPQAGVRVAYRL